MNDRGPMCNNCVYFREEEGTEFGECRRMPPVYYEPPRKQREWTWRPMFSLFGWRLRWRLRFKRLLPRVIAWDEPVDHINATHFTMTHYDWWCGEHRPGFPTEET